VHIGVRVHTAGDRAACTAILSVTSPSRGYLKAGKGERRRRPRGRADKNASGTPKSGSYLVTGVSGGGWHALPSAPARQFGGWTRDPRSVRRKAKTQTGQDAVSLHEGCCGSPEDNPVSKPRLEPSPNNPGGSD
jgi:hypothetical protein